MGGKGMPLSAAEWAAAKVKRWRSQLLWPPGRRARLQLPTTAPVRRASLKASRREALPTGSGQALRAALFQATRPERKHPNEVERGEPIRTGFPGTILAEELTVTINGDFLWWPLWQQLEAAGGGMDGGYYLVDDPYADPYYGPTSLPHWWVRLVELATPDTLVPLVRPVMKDKGQMVTRDRRVTLVLQ